MAQATAQTGYSKRLSEISKIWQDNRWLYVIAGVLLGILVTPAIEQITGHLNDLIGNLVPEAVGIVFTVLILDRLAENRAREALKKRLIREVNSRSNETAKAAVDWMRAEGWLTVEDDIQLLKDQNLYKANLINVNLHKANLINTFLVKANLEGTDLSRANLQNVIFRDANLRSANLSGANLKDAYLVVAICDEKTILPNAEFQLDDNNRIESDEEGKFLFTPESFWTPETDMSRYTDPNHPDFWQPDWVKEQKE